MLLQLKADPEFIVLYSKIFYAYIVNLYVRVSNNPNDILFNFLSQNVAYFTVHNFSKTLKDIIAFNVRGGPDTFFQLYGIYL